MESKASDRRARGVQRVDFSTLVEICGREPGTPAFEAEAIELSGRGMQVRTRYLPEMNAPLVLRFEHDGREAVVEGEVAWRQETEKGGEFGIKFTALDASSLRVLKDACSRRETKPAADESATETKAVPKTRGAPVRLHIHGLGTPMRARVFESRNAKLHVGSQLEFLKVGRTLELEDVEAGGRREAEIDAVSVTVDPATQVPQLVVSLRYEGEQGDSSDEEESTPEPSVVGDDDSSRPIEGQHRPTRRSPGSVARTAPDPSTEDEDDGEDEEADDFDGTEALFKGKVAQWASEAGSGMRATSLRVAGATKGVTEGILDLFGKATRKASTSRGKTRSPRRTTSAPGSVAISGRGLTRKGLKDRPRAQRAQQGRGDESSRPRRKKLWALGVAALVCASGAYPLFFAGKPSVPSQVALAPHPTAVSVPTTAPHPLSAASAPAMATLAQPRASGGPAAFPEPATLNTQNQLAAAESAVTADVPLFGPQQLATTERAPLTPPPNSVLDEVSMAKDQAFARPVVPALGKQAPAAEESKEKAPKNPAPEASNPAGSETDKQWQVGRMHLPIVHRLRLDGPGEVVSGEKTPSGFSVLIPGRKVMETGAAIAKRDDRILSVNVKNTPAGGKVIFRFRKEIPGYKVRVRNDYVEFFVNSKD